MLAFLSAVFIIDFMTSNRLELAPEALELLRAYVDAVLLAEPLQLRVWKSAGVTLTQLRILRVLREGKHSASELAAAAGLSAPSLTRVLDRLEELGLVARVPDPADRRRVGVEILAAGTALIDGQNIWRGTAIADAAASLDPEERRMLVASLRGFVSRVISLQQQESETQS